MNQTPGKDRDPYTQHCNTNTCGSPAANPEWAPILQNKAGVFYHFNA